MAQNFTLTVVEKIQETYDTITLKFKQPALRKVKYKPGQYLTILAKTKGRVFRRPYSIASVFGIDTTIDITVKIIEKGIVSNYLKKEAEVGDVFEIMEPMGSFLLPEAISNEQIVFWSGGSGITPAYALLKQCLLNTKDLKVLLVYCNKSRDSIIYLEKLEELQKQFVDRIDVLHILSKPSSIDNNFFYASGRINSGTVTDILISKASNTAYHYVCGPEGLMLTILDALKQMGVPGNRIYSENFHNTVDTTQMEGVKEAQVYLELNNEVNVLSVPVGKSILEMCLDKGIDFPYSCQTGACTFCKAKLVKGKIKNITIMKPERELGNDEYLLCCGYPMEDEIYLKA